MDRSEEDKLVIGPDFLKGERERYVRFSIWGVTIGFIISQFSPIWGGSIATIAEPFSPARLNLALGHSILFGFLGLIVAHIKS